MWDPSSRTERVPAGGRPKDLLGGRFLASDEYRILNRRSEIVNPKLPRPFEVLSIGGVHADDFAFVDEGWDVHHHAGFKGGGFGHVGR